MPRHAKTKEEVLWFNVKNCMVFHMGNAYEETVNGQTTVVVQGCAYPNVNMDNLTAYRNQLYEWRLTVESGEVEERAIGNASGEFPTINASMALKHHRYVYLATYNHTAETTMFTGVSKVDTFSGEILAEVTYGDQSYGGEMVFVPKANARDEDDGYLAGFVRKELESKSEFWILCAKTMNLLCRVNISARIPYGFHSMWVTREQVRKQRARSKL